ncbi:cilia- and flagella- associated protein 210 [Aulostomus maculatus]
MSSVVQYGRRRGSSKRASGMIEPPDLRQVTVLTRSDWLRIQDELNQVNRDQESQREATKQREALHLQSKDVVKQWSNTIAGQRQKKLEAKKIREQVEEERRKLTDLEEKKYKEEKRRDVIEKAKTQLYYQIDRVKGLHSALLLTEVLKEREVQIQLKKRIKNALKDMDKEDIEVMKTREDEALRREQERVCQKTHERRDVAEALKNQIKENQLSMEREKLLVKEEGEKIQQLQELHLVEQRLEEEAQAKQKRNLMQTHLEHLTDRETMKATEAQKQELEDEQRKLFLSAKRKMMKLRKDKEKELFREAQMCRENIMMKLTATQQEQTEREEQRIAKAVAEQDARQAQQQREEEEKRAAMLKSIAEHRERMRQEKEQRDKMNRVKERDMLLAKREADQIFTEKQQLKAQKMREDAKKLQDFNSKQMDEKRARQHQLVRLEREFEAKNTEAIAEEEQQFQQYSERIFRAAAEAQRNVFPICKAAKEGIGGGLGPSFGGVRPSYLVQDQSGAQMPKYITDTTREIKKLHETVDIQEAKRRLGFTW